ncbi:hypothetical protein ES708_25416 [subsurface metagenome]
MSNYLDQIASYVCQCSFDDFPPKVVTKAKQVLADSFAVIAAGAQEPEVKSLSEKIILPSDPQIATLLNGRKLTEPIKAALLNGTAGTFLELDEGNQFARGHPGMHIVSILPKYVLGHIFWCVLDSRFLLEAGARGGDHTLTQSGIPLHPTPFFQDEHVASLICGG